MQKLNANKMKWLKILHIFIIAMWIGTGFVLGVLSWVGPNLMINGIGTIYFMMEFMDTYIMKQLVIATLVTGLVFSIFTNWGFFKQRWVTVKWGILLFQILIGALFIGPLIKANSIIADTEHAKSLTNDVFLSNQTLIHSGNLVQLSLLFFMVCISVIKPWKKDMN